MESFKTRIQEQLNSIVSIYAKIPNHAFSAGLMGTERRAYGAVIREDGLIATVGYIFTDAETIFVSTSEWDSQPAYVVANDYETGIGLLKTIRPLQLKPLTLGDSDTLFVGSAVTIGTSGGVRDLLESQIVAKEEFAGRWEYLLEGALYTYPAHPDWSGTVLFDIFGEFCGIGSLMVKERFVGSEPVDSNMFIPINLLRDNMDELIEYGGCKPPPRPWLGLLSEARRGYVHVVGLYPNGPAELAGVQIGDVIVNVASNPVPELSLFFTDVWELGPAGTIIPLTLIRDSEIIEINITSSDRVSAQAACHPLN